MIKNALFLVCALVAIQGLQARSIDLEVKDTIDKIIQDITSQIPKLIQNTKDIVGKIPDIINEIKNKIETIIEGAGEIGRKCIASQQEYIDATIESAQSGMKACVAEAKSETDALKKQVDVLVGKANALRDDVIARALKCAQDNPLNTAGFASCLKIHIGHIDEQIAALRNEVVDTIAVVKEAAASIGQTFYGCNAKVETEIASKQEEIFNNIRECIQGSTA